MGNLLRACVHYTIPVDRAESIRFSRDYTMSSIIPSKIYPVRQSQPKIRQKPLRLVAQFEVGILSYEVAQGPLDSVLEVGSEFNGSHIIRYALIPVYGIDYEDGMARFNAIQTSMTETYMGVPYRLLSEVGSGETLGYSVYANP